MRRVLALAVAALMICAAFAMTAHAADRRMTLQVEDVTAGCEPGSTVKVPVKITENTGYISALFNVEWDPKALELTAVEYTDLGPDQGNQPLSELENTGKYRMRVGDSLRVDSFKDTGTFFTLVFKVCANASAGKYTVTITDPDILDATVSDIFDVDTTIVSGTVSLTSASGGGEGDMPTDAPGAGTEPAGDKEGGTTAPAETASQAADPAGSTESGKAEDASSSPTESGDTADGKTGPTDLTALWIILACVGAVLITAGVIVVVKSKGKKESK